MNSTWKAALGIILVFVLGWFGGVLSTWIFVHHKMVTLAKGGAVATASMLDQHMTHGLKLDEDQKAKVYALFLENVKKRSQLQKTVQPQVWTINQQTLQSINGLLTTDQQRKFQDNLLRFEANFGRNPFNTGPDDKTDAPANPPPMPATNASAGGTPPQ